MLEEASGEGAAQGGGKGGDSCSAWPDTPVDSQSGRSEVSAASAGGRMVEDNKKPGPSIVSTGSETLSMIIRGERALHDGNE